MIDDDRKRGSWKNHYTIKSNYKVVEQIQKESLKAAKNPLMKDF